MSEPLTIKQGATLPVLQSTLAWTGDPEDLTNVSTVQVSIRRRGDAALPLKTGSVVSAVERKVKYDWVAGETDVPGLYSYEWKLTFSDGKVMYSPSADYGEFRIVEVLDES